MPYLTPNSSAGTVTRTISIPWYLLPYVVGSLLLAMEEENWEAWGDTTPEDCAEDFRKIIAQLEEL